VLGEVDSRRIVFRQLDFLPQVRRAVRSLDGLDVQHTLPIVFHDRSIPVQQSSALTFLVLHSSAGKTVVLFLC
jgi:hypothetical protein